MSFKKQKIVLILLVLSIFLMAFATTAFAGEALPWNTSLEKIEKSLTGPAAVTFSILAVVLLAASTLFGEYGGVVRKSIGVIVGATLILQAPKIAALFGSGSGSLIL